MSGVLIGLLTAYIFLPVFYKLQLTSTFEYLEVRFARSVRQFVSVLYTIALILHTPIVVYGPALAFAQVTGFDLHLIIPIICVVCIFYTTIVSISSLFFVQFFVNWLMIAGWIQSRGMDGHDPVHSDGIHALHYPSSRYYFDRWFQRGMENIRGRWSSDILQVSPRPAMNLERN